MLHAKPCVFQQSVSGRDFLFFLGVDAEKELEISSLPSFSDHSIRQDLVLYPSLSLSLLFQLLFPETFDTGWIPCRCEILDYIDARTGYASAE